MLPSKHTRIEQIALRQGPPPSLYEARETAKRVVQLEAKLATMPERVEYKTLHDFMVTVRGNQTEAARILGVTRNTIRKFIDDRDGKYHRIINGSLMTSTQLPKGIR